MKKALMYASVASMVQQFNMNNIKILQELGYKVDVACNFEFGSTISKEKIDNLKNTLKEMNVDFYHIPVPRKIADLHNLTKSYKLTKELINRKEYNLIHCHSPIGGIICRLANKNSNNYEHSKMIYTAHGFHFFKGNNPLKNFLFRNIEKYGAKYTDILITINKEDYVAARKFKLRANGRVEYTHGVGIDFQYIDKVTTENCLRYELGFEQDDFVVLSVGELNNNKNHMTIIKALEFINNKKIKYMIAGCGSLENELRTYVLKNNLEKNVKLLGYRDDIFSLCKISNCFAFPSIREGLGLAALEAMASGVPLVATNTRGINEYLIGSRTGYSYNAFDYKGFANGICTLLENKIQRKKMSDNCRKIAKEFDIQVVNEEMKKIYSL